MSLPSKTINIEPLGTVLLEKSARAKRLNISVRPQRGVRVAIPKRASFAQGEQFLRANLDWARRQLDHIRLLQEEHQQTLADQEVIHPRRARTILITRLHQLAQAHGFTYNKVSIRNQRTRWGSCSSDKNISLNINLVRLRQDLMDYVILHELVHTEIPNHSPLFWRRLDKLVGHAKALDKQLNQHRLGLM